MFQWGIEYEWTPKFEIKHDLNNSKHPKEENFVVYT